MLIVCGTDLSEPAAQAARAAAALAEKLGTRLDLVHVVDELGVELTIASGQGAIYDPQRARLRELAQALAADFDVHVEPVLAVGFAAPSLVEIAQARGARLIVVAPVGHTGLQRWVLGSVADRLARTSPVPVLIVRQSASIEAWACDGAPLRVLVGVDPTPPSEAALRWAAELRTVGRADLVVTHVVRPGAGAHGVDLAAWAGNLEGQGDTTFLVHPAEGGVDAELAQLAGSTGADLLVVGAHQRAGIARLWHGSVSRGVLERAPCSVACVPSGAPPVLLDAKA